MKRSVYLNGNYFVIVESDGTKYYRSVRQDESTFKAEFPDSIDLKITNSCSFGCPFCHESSIPGGSSFNLSRTKALLSTLPECEIELAIGGGDILDCYSETSELLRWISEETKFLPRVTINVRDFGVPEFKEKLESIIYKYGLKMGISVNRVRDLDLITDKYFSFSPVFHIIVGIFPWSEIRKLLNNYITDRILILGFKQWGRAKEQEIQDLEKWKREIKKILYESRHTPGLKYIFGFDNLAIEQLGIRDNLTELEWSQSYMGPEFSHSMYIDAVSETFAPTSRSPERVSWSEYDNNIVKYFKQNRNED